jgi:hypothetical protein
MGNCTPWPLHPEEWGAVPYGQGVAWAPQCVFTFRRNQKSLPLAAHYTSDRPALCTVTMKHMKSPGHLVVTLL